MALFGKVPADSAFLEGMIAQMLQEGVISDADMVPSIPSSTGRTWNVTAGQAMVADSGGVLGAVGSVRYATTVGGSGTLGTGGANTSRVDQIILIPGSPTNEDAWTVEVRAGTEQAGTGTATLDNRTGAQSDATITAARADGWMRLADVLVVNTAGVYATTQRDRRLWAQGLNRTIVASAGNFSVSTTPALISSSVNPRFECTARGIEVILTPGIITPPAGGYVDLYLRVDGADISPKAQTQIGPGATQFTPSIVWEIPVGWGGPGSHLIAPWANTNTGTGTLYASAAYPFRFTVREILRQDASNG